MEAIIPYQYGPFDEPPEKAKERLAKLKEYHALELPLQIESALLDEITRPYDPNQMAGSVWLYRRQQEGLKKQ
jgi:hypothetical protein